MTDFNNTIDTKDVSNNPITSHFVSSIKSWVSIDDKIFKLKEEIKALTNEKKEFEKIVLDELDKMDNTVISIPDGKIKKIISKSQTPLKKEHIQKTLFEFTRDEKKTSDIINQMMKERQIVEKINLKRTKNTESVILKNNE